ncbi:lipopolysaccharide biosynthesis protein [Luteibacter pinisoli]|uniref:Lipopolysaccharide biosynthesis protein n=1 Tax=Luteibacter pinisoli TaxID=2589080 RepID=A0A4Y5Z0T9_9GAMM|nr:lipopolysaccharide biosynthesis protein [Luteibacter pinisoli]QDE38791.1 lipopolysaccharide biosynthesis protein [Luteibacter pinisoli]
MPDGLARSSFRTTAMLALRLLTQAVTLVAITRWLGPGRYGEYIAVASLAIVLSLIPNLGSAYVLMAREARMPGEGIDVMRYGWVLSLVFGTLLTASFPSVAQLTTHSRFTWVDLWLIGATELMATPLILLLSGALQARHKVATGQGIQWIPLALRGCLAGTCLVAGDAITFHAFVCWQAVLAVAGLFAAILITSRHIPLRWSPRQPTRDEWKDGASYAAMHIVSANPTELDKILSNRLLGEHTAGIYAATSRILNAVVIPVIGMLLAAQQRLFIHGSDPGAGGRRLIRTLFVLAGAWGIVSAAGTTLCAPLLPWILGAAYADAASIMPWVALAAPFVSLRLSAGTVLVALGHPLHRMLFELLGAVLMAVLLVAGAHYAQARGMALGLACAELCMAAAGWWMVIAAERQLRPNQAQRSGPGTAGRR